MKERKKQLNAKRPSPRLAPSKKAKRLHAKKTKAEKLRIWYKIYLATTLGTVILAALLLIVGLYDSEVLHIPKGEEIATFFLRGEFTDISGDFQNYDSDKNSQNSIFDIMNGIMIPSKDQDDSNSIIVPDKNDGNGENDTSSPSTPTDSIYDFDYSKVPDGETAVIPMDLSLSSYGATYIYNSTGYTPNTDVLMASKLSFSGGPIYISSTKAPLVLILHTHATESYLADGSISYKDTGSEMARSDNTSKNVVAVGETMAKILNDNGIPTLHCTLLHDKMQYKDSYLRAEETIKQYLKEYPSIKLVIDLHRDAVIKSTGEIVRPVTEVNSLPTAQVMCVVGSDWGGETCPNWQGNLSLALQLRKRLNDKYTALCRPTYLRPSTYNQELAPYSLLLEVGASGNSLVEAKRAATLVASELVGILKGN